MCTKKLSKTQYRVNIAKIVDEAIIPTARVIHFFDAFVSDNCGVIGALLDNY